MPDDRHAARFRPRRGRPGGARAGPGPLMIPVIALHSLVLMLMATTARVRGARAAWGSGPGGAARGGAARGGVVFVGVDLLVGPGAAGVDFTGRPVWSCSPTPRPSS
ncbi:hypothetical protein GCM10010365_68250 [Streptomyces poonensis]|uniref:Uncharacterized protein n=1 Tax=Streptomyces poonensis TaxID=68255 RepID=A0A918Q8I1_9ACTN|nr:hypothetical protein GCM10010365_68250 [Streptomyces poonensis]GLJ91115.1 hypothetical protein GCM10017589_37210 [Streptomyces poonensis]